MVFRDSRKGYACARYVIPFPIAHLGLRTTRENVRWKILRNGSRFSIWNTVLRRKK